MHHQNITSVSQKMTTITHFDQYIEAIKDEIVALEIQNTWKSIPKVKGMSDLN
jgi:hypothetical protein